MRITRSVAGQATTLKYNFQKSPSLYEQYTAVRFPGSVRVLCLTSLSRSFCERRSTCSQRYIEFEGGEPPGKSPVDHASLAANASFRRDCSHSLLRQRLEATTENCPRLAIRTLRLPIYSTLERCYRRRSGFSR